MRWAGSDGEVVWRAAASESGNRFAAVWLTASESRGSSRFSTSATEPTAVFTVSDRSSNARTTFAAACSGLIAGDRRYTSVAPIMSVRTRERRMLVKVIPSP